MCVVEKGTHLQVLGFRNYERVMELTTGCISLTLSNRNEVSYSEGKNHNLLEITEMPLRKLSSSSNRKNGSF